MLKNTGLEIGLTGLAGSSSVFEKSSGSQSRLGSINDSFGSRLKSYVVSESVIPVPNGVSVVEVVGSSIEKGSISQELGIISILATASTGMNVVAFFVVIAGFLVVAPFLVVVAAFLVVATAFLVVATRAPAFLVVAAAFFVVATAFFVVAINAPDFLVVAPFFVVVAGFFVVVVTFFVVAWRAIRL